MESSLLGAQSLVEIYDMLRSPPEEFTARMAQWERSAEKGCDFMSDFVYGSWLQGFSLDILIQLRAQHLAAITVQAWLSKG